MEDTTSNKIVIIIPIWNEEARGSFDYIESILKIKNLDFIIVNDGSSDGTEMRLMTLSSNLNFQPINLPENLGKSMAIKAGLDFAIRLQKYSIIGYLDGDGAFPVSEVQRCSLLAQKKLVSEGFDVFTTSRVALSGRIIHRKTTRHLIGRVIRTVIGLKHSNLPYDTQSGFKIFKNTEIFVETVSKGFKTKWFVDLEILLRLRSHKDSIAIWEEPLMAWQDVSQSSLKWTSAPRVILELAKILVCKQGKSKSCNHY